MTGHHIRRSDDGFTLIEMLVATTMAMIVFAVTLSTLAVFSDTSQTLTHRNDSQNQARLDIEQIVSQLRNANASGARTVVEHATNDDLVFQTIGPSDGNSQRQVRYCVAAGAAGTGPATEPLYMQKASTPPTSNDPWSTACPDTSSGSSAFVGDVANVYEGVPVFTYNGGSAPADLTAIKSVGIDLRVNPTPSDANNEYELRSTAWLRNAQYPVASFPPLTQNTSGPIVLDGSASYSPAGDSLTYQWSYSTGGGTPVDLSTDPTYTWTPAAGTYTVTLTVTDEAGSQGAESQQVTIS